MSAALNITDPNCTEGRALLRQGPLAIIAKVAAEHKVAVRDVIGTTLSRPVVRARFEALMAVHLAYPNWSYGRLGQIFGGRHHATILHALHRLGGPTRRGPVHRVWTEADDALIRKMWAEGALVYEIADALKVASCTITKRKAKLKLPRRARSHGGTLTEANVREILAMPYVEGPTRWHRRYREKVNDTAARFNVNPATIRAVRARMTWKHVARSA